MQLSEITDMNVRKEYDLSDISCKDPKTKDINKKLYKRKDKQFENTVFLYLKSNVIDLGIKTLYSFENSLIDGALELLSGDIILLEIKYALNWIKACNARIQFQRFIKQNIYEKLKINSINPNQNFKKGIIIFNHFSSDWAKRIEKRKYINGWYRFYEEQKYFENDFKIIILQLTKKKLIYEPF